MERQFKSLEELYSAEPKHKGQQEGGLGFMSSLPGLADRSLLQRFVWRFYHHPILKLHLALEQQHGFEIKEGDDWVTQEYKNFMQKLTPE